jgi:hypothetical protein
VQNGTLWATSIIVFAGDNLRIYDLINGVGSKIGTGIPTSTASARPPALGPSLPYWRRGMATVR